ncbi:hypothetical protein F2Q69_00029223 [Brassica cretica]|uniref:Uncharacterized protein n=1 Tax=Brassica cretica TaxID=69181 RepID=A0A8S9S5V1_BRACR|nr:hypothetical protein F2Q69_00029223 [Brassica cretica]
MVSTESPGSPKGLTEVTDDWKNRNEINDSGNLQRGSGLKINDEVQGKELGSGNENQNRKGESVSFTRGSKSVGSSWVDVAQEKKGVVGKDGEKVKDMEEEAMNKLEAEAKQDIESSQEEISADTDKEVNILTPSRFSVLLEVDEKGDGVNQVEYEEIISVEEEIVIEETEEELSKEENKEEEVEAKNDIMEDIKGREALVEGNKSGTGQSVAGIEHWPDLTANSV